MVDYEKLVKAKAGEEVWLYIFVKCWKKRNFLRIDLGGSPKIYHRKNPKKQETRSNSWAVTMLFLASNGKSKFHPCDCKWKAVVRWWWRRLVSCWYLSSTWHPPSHLYHCDCVADPSEFWQRQAVVGYVKEREQVSLLTLKHIGSTQDWF